MLLSLLQNLYMGNGMAGELLRAQRAIDMKVIGICSSDCCNNIDWGLIVGEWVNDSRQGKGKYYFATGEVYEGTFTNNNFDGRGIYIYANGDRVEGVFSAGQLVEIITIHQISDDQPSETYT